MGTRQSAAEKLSSEQKEAIITYFANHTFCSTMRAFNLTRSALTILLNKFNIKQHSNSEAETLKHIEQDNYDKLSPEYLESIYLKYLDCQSVKLVQETFNLKEYFIIYLLTKKGVTNINNNIKTHIEYSNVWYKTLTRDLIQTIINYYLEPNTIIATANKFNTTITRINFLLNQNNIKHHDANTTGVLGQKVAREHLEAKYGVTNVFQLDAIKEKTNKTKAAKYGEAHYTNREKAKQTCLDKFGSETFLGSAQGKKAIQKYSQETYGTDYMFQSKDWQTNSDFRDKAAKTRKEHKYSTGDFSDKYLAIFEDKQKLQDFITGKSIYQIANELNIKRDHAYYLLSKNNLLEYANLSYHFSSHYEDEITNFIGEDLCIQNDREVLQGKEIDIYIPSKKLGIEFDGTYWHSSLFKPKNYHLNKSKFAEQNNIRLIHIYEYEWEDPKQQEKIKLMLDSALGRSSKKIYARECQIKQITNNEARVLNEQIHLQGHRNAQVTYGLFYKDELVQLMSFSKTRYNKNLTSDTEWEIIRGCPGSNCNVIGGVSKLLKHFIIDYKPTKIFSYCDFNKFDGKSYEAVGMKFVGYTGADMKWVMPDHTVINRQPSHHKELKEIAKAQIFGAGSKKYVLELNN